MIALIYVIKVSFCSGLFLGYYMLVLRNKAFHQYNRYYLLISTVLSLVLPLINIPVDLFAQHANASLRTTLRAITIGSWEDEFIVTSATTLSSSLMTRENVVICMYLTGLTIFVVPLVKSVHFVLGLSKKYPREQIEDIWFYNTAEPGTPFSFFHSIYWNREIPLQGEAGQYILRHEIFHIRERHSYDLAFLELVTALLWFNPLYHLMKTELKTIHEFLADHYATAQMDKFHYAEILVLHAMQNKQITASNQFFHNQIKRRIKMITQLKTSRYNYLCKIMSLPVLFLIFCAFTLKVSQQSDNYALQKLLKKDTVPAADLLKIKQEDIAGINLNNEVVVIRLKNGDSVVTTLKEFGVFDRKEIQNGSGAQDPIFTKVEIEPDYPGGPAGWMGYLNRTFKYPGEAIDKGIEGTILMRYIIDKEGNVSNIEVMSGTTKGGLREEAIRVIKNSGKWIPAKQNGVVVKSYKIQPITFKLSPGKSSGL